jgi:hypothetical protein
VAQALENFGWSGPQFVMALRDFGYVENRHEIKEKIGGLVDQLSDTDNAYRRRAARHVAYPWAAGIIAQDAGLLPVTFDVQAWAHKIWNGALQSDSGPTDPCERALKHLVDEITARKGADIVDLNTGDDRYRREAVGFFDSTQSRYIIRESQFDALSGGFANGRAVRSHLEKQGLLVRQNANANSRTWSGYPGLGKSAQYVVLDMGKIDG